MKKDYIYSNSKLHYTLVTGNSDTPLVLIHGHILAEARLIGKFSPLATVG